MAYYIDKDALVAKIENRIKELQNLHKENEEKLDSIQKTAILLCIDECKVILSFLDTLEVKEVDLEKVFNDEFSKFSNDTDAGDYAFPIDLADFKDFAKYFFELGMSVVNRVQNESK